MIKIILLVNVFVLGFIYNSSAQSGNLQQIQDKLYQVNKSLDSAEFLAFDVEIHYSSDTVQGRFESDYQLANYVMHGHNLYMNVGGTEFMQNESFAITAYNNEKVMMATQQSVRNSSVFPLRQFVDSTLAYFSNYYSITNDSSGGVETINFITDSANIPCKSMTIAFEPRHHTLLKLEMTFMQPFNIEQSMEVPEDSNIHANITALPPLVKKRISMQFKNYRFIENLDVFKYEQYLFYDRFRKVYKPAGKYTGYKLYASGMPNTAKEFDDIETPAPVNPAPNNN